MRLLRSLPLFAALSLLGVAQQANQVPTPTSSQVIVPRLVRFSGQVKDASGTVGITFTLHKSQNDSTALWIETQNVQLDGAGKYTVLLGATKNEGLPVELFTSGEAQWLGIHIQGQPDQPRVLLVSVPYALKAAEAETLGGHSATDFVTSDKVTSIVQQQLQNPQPGTAIHGTPLGTSAGATDFKAGTPDQVVSVTQTSTGMALTATAASTALDSTSTATTGTTYGVEGNSSSPTGAGVYGVSHATSGASFGVEGLSTSPTGYGVFGISSAATGLNFGIYGQTQSTSGTALKGNATATSGNTKGVIASVSSPNGIAAIFQANNASGKILSGQSGSAHTEVFSVDGGGNVAANGTFFGSGTGLTGVAQLGAAYNIFSGYIETSQAMGDGYAAVVGHATNGSAGVFGSSDSGYGVQGYVDSGTGLYGSANGGTGATGESDTGYGVYGQSSSNVGVGGVSSSSDGVYGETSTAPQAGVLGRQYDSSGNWAIYGFGNIGASGTKSSVVEVDNATRKVALYAVESPNVWFEDYGSGRLTSGVASITIEPGYAQTVNTGAEYHVFLTPEGECEGLYVSAKTATSFEVRELHKGASNVAFSYRIIALRRGYETKRLEDVTQATPKSEIEMPHRLQTARGVRSARSK